MAENKTKPTDASVDDYIASRANAQRPDCRELMALFKRVTRQTRPTAIPEGPFFRLFAELSTAAHKCQTWPVAQRPALFLF